MTPTRPPDSPPMSPTRLGMPNRTYERTNGDTPTRPTYIYSYVTRTSNR